MRFLLDEVEIMYNYKKNNCQWCQCCTLGSENQHNFINVIELCQVLLKNKFLLLFLLENSDFFRWYNLS